MSERKDVKPEPFAYAECVESPDGVADVVFHSPLHKPDRPVLALCIQRQESEIAAEALEEAANRMELHYHFGEFDYQRRWLRHFAAQKREQAK